MFIVYDCITFCFSTRVKSKRLCFLKKNYWPLVIITHKFRISQSFLSFVSRFCQYFLISLLLLSFFDSDPTETLGTHSHTKFNFLIHQLVLNRPNLGRPKNRAYFIKESFQRKVYFRKNVRNYTVKKKWSQMIRIPVPESGIRIRLYNFRIKFFQTFSFIVIYIYTLCARRIDTFLKRLFLCHKHAKTIYYVVLACL